MLSKALFAALFAFVAWCIMDYILFMGYLNHVYSHHPGPCRPLPGVERGAEDAVLLPNGHVLFSSGLRDAGSVSPSAPQGQIYMYDMTKADMAPKSLLTEADLDLETFVPLGGSAWSDPKTGVVYLYVINQMPASSVVEKFTYLPDSQALQHEATFGSGDPAFRQLNDLIVVGKDAFYFTNMYWYQNNLPEVLLGLSWATVGYFNGSHGKIAATGLALANGIEMSPDKRFLYVACSRSHDLAIFSIQSDMTLLEKERVPLGTMADNLFVEPASGNLWFAAHPVGWKTFATISDYENNTSPSQVFVARMKDGAIQDLTQVLSDDGAAISGSSVSLVHGNTLFIGSVAQKAYVCELKHY